MSAATTDAPRTGAVQGDLWGTASRDWSELMEPAVRPLFEAALDALDVREGTRALDIGCGSGLFLQLACARGASAEGVDAAAGMLAIARERVPQAGLQQGDVEELPFAGERFDAVSGFNSFQY